MMRKKIALFNNTNAARLDTAFADTWSASDGTETVICREGIERFWPIGRINRSWKKKPLRLRLRIVEVYHDTQAKPAAEWIRFTLGVNRAGNDTVSDGCRTIVIWPSFARLLREVSPLGIIDAKLEIV